MTALPFIYDDGGRAAAGYRGTTGDCVVRAVAIATGIAYGDVYDRLFARARELGAKDPSPRRGVLRDVYDSVLADLGWSWTATMRIGQGCKVHLAEGELPGGALVVRLSRHLCAVVDGVAHDIYDPSRDGTRCVYGYWQRG